MQRLPVCSKRSQNLLVVNQFSLDKEVEVHGQAFQMQRVHRLAAASLDVKFLLLRGAVKLTGGHHEPLGGCVLNELAHVAQKCGLFAA